MESLKSRECDLVLSLLVSLTIMRHAVLLIEEHEGTRESLRKLLAGEGCVVRTAANAAGGLALLRSNPDCCVILLHWSMPETQPNGGDFLRALRVDVTLPSFPVIAISGDDISVEMAHAAGARCDASEVRRTCGGTHAHKKAWQNIG
jgi:CheY-like chemotaxis protein